ncbi:hypothetical protein V5O48_015631 [Marasmius crinis-equi]|uniref:Uncharacterized protein n=1 Tax=Marasmius crinis-equi TaxID=585013 RepID=A0ABR3EU00_9AGAR
MNLPAWSAISVFHDNTNPCTVPPNPNTPCFIEGYVERAITERKQLRVTIEVGSDRKGSITATKALRELLREGVLWRSCGYLSWDEGSLRMLCEILDELGERCTGWDKFEVDIGEPPVGDLSLVEVIRRMCKMQHLQEAIFELGWPAGSCWVWNRSPEAPFQASCLHGVQRLEVKASPSLCLGLLGVMSGVTKVCVYLDWEENNGWGVFVPSQKPAIGNQMLRLTRLTHMEVYMGSRDISHASFFQAIHCPRLRHFSVEWFEWDRGNGVEVVQDFLWRLSQAVTGAFYLPNAITPEVKVFDDLGLIERVNGSRSWVDL